jgi:hypothetical protein
LEWLLRLNPNGHEAERKGHIAVFIRLHTANATATLKVTVGAGVEPEFELQTGKVFSTCTPRPEGSGTSWGCGNFLSHKTLLGAFDAHVPGGVLTVRCTLRACDEAAHDATNPIDVPAPGLSAAWARCWPAAKTRTSRWCAATSGWQHTGWCCACGRLFLRRS